MTALPERIRLSRERGWRKPHNTVAVSRPTKFGNPFGPPDGLPTGTRQMLVDEFVAWLRWPDRHYRAAGTPGGFASAQESVTARQRLVDALPELTGMNLGCWCHLDQPCHADALLDVVAGRLRITPLRVLVTGSRNWEDYGAIERAFQDLLSEWGAHPALVTVVHGGARGLDSAAQHKQPPFCVLCIQCHQDYIAGRDKHLAGFYGFRDAEGVDGWIERHKSYKGHQDVDLVDWPEGWTPTDPAATAPLRPGVAR